jgi:hypothetical protein
LTKKVKSSRRLCPTVTVLNPITVGTTAMTTPSDSSRAARGTGPAGNGKNRSKGPARVKPKGDPMNAPLDAWNTTAENFPADGTSEEKLWFVAQYAVLAPSSHNSQPWKFRIHGNLVDLYADLGRALPVVDPENRELIISCGAALFHLRTAIRYFGYACDVEPFPDAAQPTLLARAHLGFKCDTTAEDVLLFNAIPKRRTNRQAFLPDAVPDALLSALGRVAAEEGAWLRIIEGEEARFATADLVAEADRVQWTNKQFRHELAEWLHPNRSDSHDGIPGYAQGDSALPNYAGPAVIRTFDLGKGLAAKHWDIALYSPALAVLGTDTDTQADWLSAGQALANVLLRARVEDVWTSFLNQPIELPHLRPKLAEILGIDGSPQILLRLGFGPDVKPTPRRPVRDVIIRPQDHTIALTPT